MAEMNGKVSIFDDFVTSKDREEDGVWRMIDGHKFKIARANNPKHQSLIDALPAATRRAWANGSLPQEEADALTARMIGRGMLRGWDEERYAEPFTDEMAEELCRKAPHLRDAISMVAADYSNYLARDAAADAKN